MDGADTQPQDESQQQKMESLAQAFEMFTKTTASLESAYELLEQRVQSLDAELQEKNRALEMTTEYLNSILNSMSDGVVVVAPDQDITTFNPSAATVLGIDPAETIGKPCGEILGESFAQGEGLREVEWSHPEEGMIPITLKTSPIVDQDGTDIGTVTLFQDMREIEALREQVRRRDRLAAIGEMAATVAHEIRNPLGGIQGFASLLQRDLETDSPQYRLVEKIVTGTKNLNRVVSALLEYTRPMEVDARSVDGRELIASALAYCPLEGDRIVMENKVPKEVCVRGDAHLLRQAFLNLIINAQQSISAQGRIVVEAMPEEGHWVFQVSDTGSGMGEEALKQIFMPFFTTKEKGTGLGLAVVQKTVEAHGGSIRVQSEINQGTTFSVSIPRGV